MKIAVVNSGSSSLKFQLFSMKPEQVLCHILIEKIAAFSSTTTLEYGEEKTIVTSVISDHKAGLQQIIELLAKHKILDNFSSLDAIGHRVVHGGEEFTQATLIDADVIKKIKSLIPLAPLHNKANLEGILVAQELAPLVPQVAVFDTSFHANMPQEAFLYALDYELYEKHKIRRYGFHGSSHAYILERAANLLQKEKNLLNIISLHLGNGASVCAIKNGISVDTSMGFTPLEGLVMGSRCGDIDPAIVLYIQREIGLSIDEVDTLLNKNSGLLGVCGTQDLREIIASETQRSKLAIEIMVRRIKKYIGGYMALLGRVDAIVLTGGIGENSVYIREKIFEDFPFGVALDLEKNRMKSNFVSKAHSSVSLMVIQTDEELFIAKESLSILDI